MSDYPQRVLFRRKPAEPSDEAALLLDDGSTGTDGVDRSAAEAPKGRPTPKRSDARQATKQRMAPPKDRREAMARQRALAREERVATRNALSGAGDKRDLPARDRGPLREFVRSYVDSRRTLGEFFIFVGLAIVLLTFVPNVELRTYATTAWLALLVMFVLEGFLLANRIKRELANRFPDPKPSDLRRGAVFYGVMRSFQLRRLRLPKPTVKPGTKI